MTLTSPATSPASRADPRVLARRRAARLGAGLLVLFGVLVLVAFVSITLGSRAVTLSTVVQAFVDYDPASTSQTVVREMRVPRTLLGVLAGAALGASGAILQGVTRNPLADPGIMGINAGAAALIVTGVLVLGVGSAVSLWLAFLGAGAAMVVVYGIASLGREGATAVKLALAGAAVTAGLTSYTSGVVMTHIEALDQLRFWQVGSLAGRYGPVLARTAPFLLLGLLVALLVGRLLNGLALGEDVARGLGQRVGWARALMFVTVAVLCGAATAACGPIVFVGLVVPHLARLVCGPDYRWVMAYSVLLAPVLLLGADVLGRVLGSPGEVQVGVVLGVLGAPAFIALVRFRDLAEL